jgi:putative Holliday junction resolvase
VIEGRILGLDPGERRIGVALSDPTGIIAQPHEVIDRKVTDPVKAVQDLVREYEIVTVVIGLPVSLSGGEGPAAQAARTFGETMRSALDVDVLFQDERFTTVTAEEALIEGGVRREKRRDVRDKVAAAVMLQAFLDSRHYNQ